MIAENYYDGLIAEWYDDWLSERKDDINYYVGEFDGFRGRVLELACGTGRILIPIARRGVSIDGVDSSADMLKKLASKLRDENLSARSFRQSMTDFHLPDQYDAIFVSSGSFQLLTTDEDARACLSSVRTHLRPGGHFLLDVFVPWASIRAKETDALSVTRDCKRADGSRCIVSERLTVDIEHQIVNSVFRYEVFRHGSLEHSMVGDFPLRWYWEDEIRALLHESRFANVEMLTGSPLYKKGSCFVLRSS